MATKIKGLALIGAVALHLSSTSANAAENTPQDQAAPENMLQLSEADLRQLEKLGISTTQAEIDAELAEAQQNPEVYGPVDPSSLQRRVDKDMQETLGDDYSHSAKAYEAYMAELRQRYERGSSKVRIVLLENYDSGMQAHISGAGVKFRQEF